MLMKCFTCQDELSPFQACIVSQYSICENCHRALWHHHKGNVYLIEKELEKINVEKNRKQEVNDKARYNKNPISIDEIVDFAYKMTKEQGNVFKYLE